MIASTDAVTAKVAQQATKHFDVFQKVKLRVVAFKEDKNLSPANYEALLADVNAKEEAALTAIEAVRTAKLDCAAEGSQKRVGTYVSTTVHTAKDALKAYRTSIKNLIVGVKQAIADSGTEAADDTTSTKEEQ